MSNRELAARLRSMATATASFIAEHGLASDGVYAEHRQTLAEAADALSALEGEGATPVAWCYDLASVAYTFAGKQEYTGWTESILSHTEPVVPDGSIRNLTPLYLHPAPLSIEQCLAQVSGAMQGRDWWWNMNYSADRDGEMLYNFRIYDRTGRDEEDGDAIPYWGTSFSPTTAIEIALAKAHRALLERLGEGS